MNTNSYSSIRNFPLYSFLTADLSPILTLEAGFLVLPFFSEDSGSTKATHRREVYRFLRTKLLDIIQNDLPDYELKKEKSLYKAPESV